MVRRWLTAHPRFQLHLSAMGASWLGLVDRFLGDLAKKPKHRNARQSIKKLEAAVRSHIETSAASPSPFIWTKVIGARSDRRA
jgi:hypothetical protein